MSTLSRLESRFDLEAYLEELKPKKYGEEWAIACPICEKEDKLWVRMKKKTSGGRVIPRGSFICYYCRDQVENEESTGYGLGILQLIQWLEDVDFPEACKRLADGGTATEISFSEAVAEAMRAFDPAKDEDDTPEQPPEVDLPHAFIPITEDNAPAYLFERGISVERAIRYGMGFCKRGYYRNRLLVPAYQEGRLVGFQARYMKKKPPFCKATELPCKHCGGSKKHGRIKKTFFPKGMKKNLILFNYDEARLCSRVVIVEDPFSAMHIGRTAVSVYGTGVSSRQFELLLGMEAREIVLMFDRDAIAKAYKQVAAMTQFWNVRVVELPDKRDPDEHKVTQLKRWVESAKLLTVHDAWTKLLESRLSSI